MKSLFFISLFIYPALVFANPITYTCSPDALGKNAIDGSGYDYKSGEFVALPGTQAWSKMLLRFETLDAPQSVGITIYGAFVQTADPELSARIISSDDKAITFFYQRKKSDPKAGDLRESWFFTLFPKSNTLFFSLHSFDNQGSEFWNSPPIVRGQIFKARCVRQNN